MSSSPRRLLAAGFLVGYFVLFSSHWVIAPAEPFDLEDFLVALTAYVLFVGGTLSVPWVLLRCRSAVDTDACWPMSFESEATSPAFTSDDAQRLGFFPDARASFGLVVVLCGW